MTHPTPAPTAFAATCRHAAWSHVAWHAGKGSGIVSGIASRAGFNLLEILLSMFILGLGMIIIAASMPVALRQSAASQDLSISSFAARTAATFVQSFGHPNQLPNTTTQAGASNPCIPGDALCVHWFGDNTDIASNGRVNPDGSFTGFGTRRWFLRNPAGAATPPSAPVPDTWYGWAIPIKSDSRYAYQMFYRRIPMPGANPAVGPFVYNVSIVVQNRLDYFFYPPVQAANRASLRPGDIYCTPYGAWRFVRGNPLLIPVNEFGWGVPGGVVVFETTVSF